jgi:transposase
MHARVQRLVSVVIMVTMFEECATKEQPSVVLFFMGKRTQCEVYSQRNISCLWWCLSRKAVHSWVEKFSQGRSKVADDARPGHPVEIATEATVQWVEELIRADRRITIDNVTTALGCSYGLAYSIMRDCLMFREVCTVGAQRTVG